MKAKTIKMLEEILDADNTEEVMEAMKRRVE